MVVIMYRIDDGQEDLARRRRPIARVISFRELFYNKKFADDKEK
jgi:hypothetical protein